MKFDYRVYTVLALVVVGAAVSVQALANLVGAGRAFTLGPLQSQIENIELKDLTGDGSLTSDRFSIQTSLSSRAWSPELFYEYSLDDTRFDEVQAYYYVQVALDWFRNNLNAELSQPLTVKVHVGGDEPTNAAFYYGNQVFLGRGDGVLYQNMIHDPTIVMHEVAHAIIDQASGIANSGPAGAMNEAFADFFTALILDHPLIGEASYLQGPFRRNLKNDFRAFIDFQGKKYDDSLVLSGTLWQIAQALGKTKGAMVGFELLKRLGTNPSYADVLPSFEAVAAAKLEESDQATVRRILYERNWQNSH